MLRALLYFLTSSYMPIIFEASYHVPVLLILNQVCTYDVVLVLTKNALPAQLSTAIYSSAAQRSAVQCRALPFVFGAVSCGAVFSFELTAAVTSSSCSTRYDTDTKFMYVRVLCTRLFAFLS